MAAPAPRTTSRLFQRPGALLVADPSARAVRPPPPPLEVAFEDPDEEPTLILPRYDSGLGWSSPGGAAPAVAEEAVPQATPAREEPLPAFSPPAAPAPLRRLGLSDDLMERSDSSEDGFFGGRLEEVAAPARPTFEAGLYSSRPPRRFEPFIPRNQRPARIKRKPISPQVWAVAGLTLLISSSAFLWWRIRGEVTNEAAEWLGPAVPALVAASPLPPAEPPLTPPALEVAPPALEVAPPALEVAPPAPVPTPAPKPVAPKPVAPKPVAPKPARQPASVAVQLATAPTTEEAVPAAAPGLLRVRVNQEVRLHLDGDDRGIVSEAVEFTLPATLHKVHVVSVETGRSQTILLRMDPSRIIEISFELN